MTTLVFHILRARKYSINIPRCFFDIGADLSQG